MSIPNLPVNFKDDVLASSNAKRKYQQTFNTDGSVSFEDVTRYTQNGSVFGASQVNQTNGAVNNIYDERILTLEELALVTEPGYFVDAMAVSDLNGKKVEKTISGTTSQYGNLTSDILASEYYIESVKSTSGLICIPYTTTGGYWAINARASGTFDSQPNVQITLTALCSKF